MSIKFNTLTLFLTFVLIIGIFPATSLMGLTLPWQYIMIPIFMFVPMFVLMGWIKIPRVSNLLFILWLLVIVEVLFSAVFSPMVTLGRFNFPTESIQYISRFLFFITFIAIFYNYKVDCKKFMYHFSGVLLAGMMIGVVQFFDLGSISSMIRDLYSFSDRHLGFMTRENPSSRRISGVAHFATATGGIAAFTLIIIVSLHMFNKKRLILSGFGIFLVIFNIVASQARMGYLTVVFSMIVFYFVYNRVYRKGIKSTVVFSTIVASITGFIYWLYQKGNPFIAQAVFRWERLEQQVGEGGNRVGQIPRALEQLNTPFEYLFGISRGVQNTIPSLYMEVEPVNIFMLYGSVGFVLQYTLILVLLIYFFKNMRVVRDHPILLAMVVSSFVGLISYQFFSMAYFFFRETYVGLFPWILMGATIGAVEKFKRRPEDFEMQKRVLQKQSKKRKRTKVVWSK